MKKEIGATGFTIHPNINKLPSVKKSQFPVRLNIIKQVMVATQHKQKIICSTEVIFSALMVFNGSSSCLQLFFCLDAVKVMDPIGFEKIGQEHDGA